MIKTYKELRQLPTHEERFKYLATMSTVGESTFGFNRYLNQMFYHSTEWKKFRRDMIIRDKGCDLGIEDRPIKGRVILHHINPISEDDILDGIECLMDPNNVICVSHQTHNAIHYGDYDLVNSDLITRVQGDTKLW